MFNNLMMSAHTNDCNDEFDDERSETSIVPTEHCLSSRPVITYGLGDLP